MGELILPEGVSPSKRPLKWECEFQCQDCGRTIMLRTFLAIAEGQGQVVVCKCKRPYLVHRHKGAKMLPKGDIRNVQGYLPPMSSIGVLQPPHKIMTLPLEPNVCYRCGIAVDDHQPEPS